MLMYVKIKVMYTYTYYTLWYDLILFESVWCDSKLDMIWYDTIWYDTIGHALVRWKRQLRYHKGITNTSNWMIWILWRETLKELMSSLVSWQRFALEMEGNYKSILERGCFPNRSRPHWTSLFAGLVGCTSATCQTMSDVIWHDLTLGMTAVIPCSRFFGKLHWNFIVQSWV